MAIRSQTRVSIEALDERVGGLEVDIQKLDSSMIGLRTDMTTAIGGIHAKLDRQAQPQWGVIWAGMGVLLLCLTTIGTLAYMPIRENQQELKRDKETAIQSLITRDQRIWDALLDVRRDVDRLVGSKPPSRGSGP